MQLVENLNPVPPLHNREKIEGFIDQSLLGDWIIRVEYAGTNSHGQTDWLQWGSTRFAIRSPNDVMQDIDSCHAYFPNREIRIKAEKVRPETHIAYSVYRPTEASSIDHNTVNVSVNSDAANQEWTQLAEKNVVNKSNSKWRFLAAAGTLAGTLIMLESVSS